MHTPERSLLAAQLLPCLAPRGLFAASGGAGGMAAAYAVDAAAGAAEYMRKDARESRPGTTFASRDSGQRNLARGLCITCDMRCHRYQAISANARRASAAALSAARMAACE